MLCCSWYGVYSLGYVYVYIVLFLFFFQYHWVYGWSCKYTKRLYLFNILKCEYFFTNGMCYRFRRKNYTCTLMSFDWARHLVATDLHDVTGSHIWKIHFTLLTWVRGGFFFFDIFSPFHVLLVLAIKSRTSFLYLHKFHNFIHVYYGVQNKYYWQLFTFPYYVNWRWWW